MALRNCDSTITTLGLILGVTSMIGLAVSLLTLLPMNVYNTVIALKSLKDLLQYEYIKHGQLGSLSKEVQLCLAFLAGSIVSSLTTVIMVFGVCFRSTKSLARVDHNSTPPVPTTPKGYVGLISRERELDLESANRSRQEKSYDRPPSKWVCLTKRFMYISQIIWACFGTYLLFFMDLPADALPDNVFGSAVLSLSILWLNYAILSVFTFILLFISFLLILGGGRRDKKKSGVSRARKYGIQVSHERTPLLKESPIS
ncbi:hypothetical protein J3Q64DRAFT_1747113 [Phycomyces blakesleeanus]